ncbi:hypothetical protein [Breznakiella homolactica]|uniref:Uncharacterized protein n=1 Tax=Breznakiella homolactica TaxID=2798577 RepID=A0A7T7XN11_9SPIR|nr:hypothetical protein [Breznakiella homolactica]QQO09311.1 hypothetical protein JFL75_20670 [Breznakiella homolactica]
MELVFLGTGTSHGIQGPRDPETAGLETAARLGDFNGLIIPVRRTISQKGQ